jgi:hypothetical protein
MTKYRKRPIVIEAMQVPAYSQEKKPDSLAWARLLRWIADCRGEWLTVDYHGIEIKTLEGVMLARPGDWIIRGVAGEIYPCKPDIFEATYELAEDLGDPDG